ncbi:putative sensor histidine kinase TcrY [bacterium HR41]|nr:putative sensor histidine kinase TcrY [bacterium HR41]
MHSLQARLVATVIALAGVALVVAGALTYVEQRDFQYRRIDEQLRLALVPLARDLGIVTHRRLPPRADDDDHQHERFELGTPPPAIGPSLPAGTYGEVRTRNGDRVLARTIFNPFANGDSGPYPKLPKPPPTPRSTATIETSSGRYRVASVRLPSGNLLVAAVPTREADDALRRLLVAQGVVTAIVLFGLGAASWIVVRFELLPLARITAAAERISSGHLDERVGDGDPRSEVGRLSQAFDRMVDRLAAALGELERSEQRLREFLADASHELRTPLAAIRGYADLYRLGAAREPDQVAKAMERIGAEAARMGSLVDDMLALARLEEPNARREERVDLARLLREVADDARVRAPERVIRVHAPDELIVRGSDGELRQLLGNLVANALTHTPPGAPVELSGQRRAGAVEIAVRDYGRGLPPGDPERLFERFWRAAPGRTRGRAGAGLGLAIVKAIAEAHGGEVTATNAAGGGALFTVRLPDRATHPPGDTEDRSEAGAP